MDVRAGAPAMLQKRGVTLLLRGNGGESSTGFPNDLEAMLDVILALKFVHMITMALMFGTWACIALFMLLAYRSGKAPVAALTARFVVRAELTLMVPAIALQPLVGYPLAVAIGDQLDEYWLEASVAVYTAVVAAWLANLFIELRIRKVTHMAALGGKALPPVYRRLFAVSGTISVAGLAGMTAIMALMVFQPHWY